MRRGRRAARGLRGRRRRDDEHRWRSCQALRQQPQRAGCCRRRGHHGGARRLRPAAGAAAAGRALQAAACRRLVLWLPGHGLAVGGRFCGRRLRGAGGGTARRCGLHGGGDAGRPAVLHLLRQLRLGRRALHVAAAGRQSPAGSGAVRRRNRVDGPPQGRRRALDKRRRSRRRAAVGGRVRPRHRRRGAAAAGPPWRALRRRPRIRLLAGPGRWPIGRGAAAAARPRLLLMWLLLLLLLRG